MLQRTVLKNGLTLLLEQKPSKSIALSLLTRFGSSYEKAEVNGIAHFIEHLLFNGPKGVSKKEIAARIEGIGGEINAVTGNNFTVVFVQVLGKHFDIALKTLRDLTLRPYFAEKDVDFEKKIILNEIRQLEDNPEHLIFDLVMENVFAGHPLGKPVLGKRETVQGIGLPDVQENFARFYVPNNMVLALSGSFTEKQVQQVKKVFGKKKKRKLVFKKKRLPKARFKQKIYARDFRQTHYALAFKAMNSKSKDVYAMHLISAILGGGLSSRLMQEIREKRGLAYVVHVSFEPYQDYSIFTVYVGTKKEHLPRIRKLIFKEFQDLRKKLVSGKELKQAKNFLEGKLLLKAEDALEANKNNLTMELYGEKNVHEFLNKVYRVKPADVKRIAKNYLKEKTCCEVIIQPKV